MKKIRYIYQSDPISMPSFPKKTLFLDIETTGFERRSTFLTVLGLAWSDGDSVIIEQWLNETGVREEPLLLLELESFLKDFTTVVHYNGTTFDLPYLKAKYQQYHLPTSLNEYASLDLYHLAKKYSHFLALPGLRQKDLEEAFGLFREDKLSGRELIEVYLNSIRTGDETLMQAYLLHNKEDMEGMLYLQHLVQLDRFFRGNFQIDLWNEGEIVLTGELYLPHFLSGQSSDIFYRFECNHVFLLIPVRHMKALYFYNNYQDYYYLPKEDYAIHKSVAAYVEKDFRKKATRETCYIKKEASFLPFPLPARKKARKECLEECSCFDLFYRCYGDDTAWILKNLSSPEHRIIYLKWLLAFILESRSLQ